MAEQAKITRTRSSQLREIGRLQPRTFREEGWWRFSRDRRRGYVRRLGGPPDERQGLLISQLVTAEWNKLKCEHEARGVSGKAAYDLMKLAAEWSRQLLLLDRDLARTMPPPAPQPAAPSPSLAEVLAERRA
jgi:hypothetical protein